MELAYVPLREQSQMPSEFCLSLPWALSQTVLAMQLVISQEDPKVQGLCALSVLFQLAF